jgi:hypothetical protein
MFVRRARTLFMLSATLLSIIRNDDDGRDETRRLLTEALCEFRKRANMSAPLP